MPKQTKEYIYANCYECGASLPGIHGPRIRKNPNRRCMSCYRKSLRGYSLSCGYVRLRNKKYLHDVVMESIIGRALHKGEVVHHINGDKADNRPENLKLYSNPGHHVLLEGHVIITRNGFASPNSPKAKDFRK